MSSLSDMQNSARAAAAKAAADPSAPSMPTRGVERIKSSGLGRRAPGRSKSHKIGRPAFSTELPPEPQRGVNRNKSGRLRSAPSRSRSSGKTAPDRGASTGSLKKHRKPQTPAMQEIDDVSVSDSVFTSASNQTLDSIALRKKQFGPGDAKPGGMRMPARSEDESCDFDDESLHTVDSIMMHHRHVDNGGDDEQGDMSVFSESFASSNTYDDDFSDYEEEDGADVREVEFEEDFDPEEDRKNAKEDAAESMKALTLVDE
jgi:hypothetical protein